MIKIASRTFCCGIKNPGASSEAFLEGRLPGRPQGSRRSYAPPNKQWLVRESTAWNASFQGHLHYSGWGDVDCGHCPSCPASALLGATKAQALETQPLPGIFDGNRSGNALFFTAHRLFQAHIQIFSCQGRTNRLGQMIDVSANRGRQTLSGATGGKLGNPVDNGTGKLDLIFRSETENQ
jgi:hypothetical protein